MEQQSFTASEQTENSSSTSEPMQEPLAVTAAGEVFLLLPDQEAACTATLPGSTAPRRKGRLFRARYLREKPLHFPVLLHSWKPLCPLKTVCTVILFPTGIFLIR